jgi:hypothetical protein
LRDVKKRYGTNTLRIEFEGNGEFLKTSPLVSRADVYQNYAELELYDIRKSKELLSKLDDRLNLRKFEIVEPSLNSIFIHVVGPSPAAAEEVKAPMLLKKAPKVPADPRVKKEIRSVMMSILAVAIILAMTLFSEDPLWYLPVVFLAFVGFSVFKYMRVKKQVDTERQRTGGRGEGGGAQ